MFMFHFIRKSLKTAKHHPRLGGLEILKYIGPGLLVTVGFIDPGNWASNLAAGADYGLYPFVDGIVVYGHVDHFAAQCGSLGDCYRAVSFRSHHDLYPAEIC